LPLASVLSKIHSMGTPSNTPPLDYRGIPPRKPLVRQPETPESRKWRKRRWVFRGGLATMFLLIAGYFGPNLLLFGKLTRLGPDDFVSFVESRCVPTVRAIKEYARDNGHLPATLDDLAPKYSVADQPGAAQMWAGQFQCYSSSGHDITYDFTPGHEGWYVSGRFANGRIPSPLVTIASATRPATIAH
jgi:hypothetical protein